ncbi:ATP-binding protein [Streptomyces sp. NPDC060000]|uniref:ATP-binding protein n=1 Tax=Streptomyces sp. NPDC060000 TaxID=3347031 RepID=UPI0036C2147F
MGNLGELSPYEARDAAGFVESMQQLKKRSGLTYRALEEQAARNGDVLARSTLADILRRTSLPHPDLLAAFVRACGDGHRVGAWLDAGNQVRRRLAEEADSAPGPSPQRLDQRTQTGDPALVHTSREPLGPEPVVPRSTAVPLLPSARPGTIRLLHGRTAETRTLSRILDDAANGTQHITVLSGEPGIGKSHLLRWLEQQARTRNFAVLVGRSTEFERVPYGAFVDALDDALSVADQALPEKIGSAALDLLQAVFPALSGRTAGGERTMPAERFRVHRAVRALLEVLGSGAGLALLLDDLHWADQGTIELVDHLVRHPPALPFVLAIAHRPRQTSARLTASLARAEASGLLVGLELGPLSPAHAAGLLGVEVSGWRRDLLYAASGGNPLYLQALARRSGAEALAPRCDGATAVGDDIPASIRGALLEELEGASPLARAVIRAAAVLGDPFEAELAAAVAQRGEEDVAAALDELVERDLVRETGRGSRLIFRHPLVRSTVLHQTGAGWRRAAHARAAGQLAARGAEPTVQALHVAKSARPGDPRAIAVLTAAAHQMLPVAPATAAHWTAEALRLLGPDASRHPDLWLLQAHALCTAGHLHKSLDVLDEAHSLLPPEAHRDRARTVEALATAQRLLGRYHEATALLEQETLRCNDLPSALTTALYGQLAAVRLCARDFTGATVWGVRAMRLAEASGDPVQTTVINSLLALAYTSVGDMRQGGSHLSLAHQGLGTSAFDERRAGEYLDALLAAGWANILQERFEEALRHFDRGLAVSRRTSHSHLLTDLLTGAAYASLWLGRLEQAGRYAEDAMDAAALTASAEPRSMALAVNAAVTLWAGNFTTALEDCEKAMAEAGDAVGGSLALAMLGQARLLDGDPAGCVRAVLRAGGGPDLAEFEASVRALWFRLLAAAEAARADTRAAAHWADRAAAAAAPTGLRGQKGFALLAWAEAHLTVSPGPAGQAALNASYAFHDARMPLYEALARTTAATALTTTGQPTAAAAEAQHAAALFSRYGALSSP